MNKKLLIITPNLQNASSGGLMWIEKFSKYAMRSYDQTEIIDVMQMPKYIRKNRLINIIYYFIMLLRKKNSFIFVDHNLHVRLSVPLLLTRLLTGNRYAVITFHVLHILRRNPVMKKIEYCSEKLLLKNAEIIIVSSKNTYQDIMKFRINPDKIRIIYPASSYRAAKEPERKTASKLLFIGNLEPRKGIDILIRALYTIKNMDFSLDIVGDFLQQEQYYKYLISLVDKYDMSKKIKFLGHVNAELLQKHFDEANIFIFPSLHEGYGIVLLEAMNFGLPIIASDIAPITEILTHGVHGFLFPPGDHEALAGYIKELLCDTVLQRKIGLNNYLTSKKFPTWETVINQTFQAVRPFLDDEDRN